MATIIARPRRDGTVGYTAQIVVRRKEQKPYTEAQTFDRKPAAVAWADRRETELRKPGAIEQAIQQLDDPTLREVIERYERETKKVIRASKASVLRIMKSKSIAQQRCSTIDSQTWIDCIETIKGTPGTRAGYLSHMAPIVKIAGPKWRYKLNRQEFESARTVCSEMGIIGKSERRSRRPTIDELDRLIAYFIDGYEQRPSAIPMHTIIPFAIFSTRRQDEITRLRWTDREPALGQSPPRVLVRDMKHPGDKKGNDTWCELTPEANAHIDSMSRTAAAIFPYRTKAIGRLFSDACLFLGINNKDMPDEERLHFHDLRHDGISRLFEMGRTVPLAASVSGHRSWQSLQRYTHIRQTGDKYENWKWRTP